MHWTVASKFRLRRTDLTRQHPCFPSPPARVVWTRVHWFPTCKPVPAGRRVHAMLSVPQRDAWPSASQHVEPANRGELTSRVVVDGLELQGGWYLSGPTRAVIGGRGTPCAAVCHRRTTVIPSAAAGTRPTLFARAWRTPLLYERGTVTETATPRAAAAGA